MPTSPVLDGHPAHAVDVPTGSGTVRLGAEWLRDHCRCEACWPKGSQRQYEAWAAPAPAIRGVRLDADHLVVEFEPDGHIGTYRLGDLEVAGAPPTPIYDLAGDLESSAWHSYPEVQRGGEPLLALLADVERRGLGLLRAVPCEVGHVARVAELFSFVLSTNYGRIFDVRTKPSPANLAFSDRGLGLHTDNPYRDPVPTLQLLHCLVAAPDGGLSRFLDGVAFARRFRRTDRVEFDLLATVAIDFTYEDETDLLTARSPIIELDAHGEVAAIRHNSRSARPPASDADSSNAWYAAYRSFAHQLEADPSIRELALQPGDLVCFDNRRVLHGRTAFTEVTAPRHLQGCYAAMDAVRSRLAAERLSARFA